MNVLPFQPSILDRDHKLFFELSPQEADVWIARLFDEIRPQMHLIRAMTFDGDTKNAPLNLEVVLMVAARKVREVAVSMADALLTPERQQQIIPLLSGYCDELLAEGRGLDATFVEQGLIGIRAGKKPGQNILLVEICIRSIFHQVSMINGDPNKTGKAL